MTGKEAREALLNKGVVLSELADKLGITAQTLNSRLNAKFFKTEYLDEILNITGISLEEPKVDEHLLEIIASQQRTIESLSRTIENLSNSLQRQ